MIAAVLLCVALGAAAIGLSVHSPAAARAGYTEALVVAQRPMSLDPLVDSADPAVVDLGTLLYRGLMRLDSTAYPVPDLASSISVSANGLTYAATLSRHARWSSGQPVTATEVATTIGVIRAAPIDDASLTAAWSGVSVRSSGRTVTFTLASPRASFEALLAQTPILPFSSAVDARKLMANPAVPMPTSGAYVVSSASTTSVELVVNAHAAAPPALKRVSLLLYASFTQALPALRSGAAEGLLASTPSERSQLARVPGVTLHTLLTFQFADLVFNQTVPALAAAVVRQAIGGAVDRAALIAGPLEGAATPMVGAIPVGIEWLQGVDPPPDTNMAAAETALTSAGFVPGPGGVRHLGSESLRLTLSVPDVAPLPAVAAAIAHQLAPVGIALSVATVAPQLYLGGVLESGDYQLALADWDSGPDPDISAYWRSNATPPAGLNVTGAPADAFLDHDLDGLATLQGRNAREQAATRVVAEIAANNPAVFLYAPTVCLAVRTSQGAVVIPTTGGEAARWADLASWPSS